MPFFQIRVTTEQREQLREVAERKGISSTEYIRSLVPELQSAGRATDPQRSEGTAPPAVQTPPPAKPEASERAGSLSGIDFTKIGLEGTS